MTRFSSLLLCALSASAVLPFQAAQAQNRSIPTHPGTISTEIDLSSLDLTSAQGWHRATKQIGQASHAVCQQLHDEGWLTMSDVTDCEQDAFSNARNGLYDIRNQQRARHQTGHVLLALSARK